MDFDWKFAGQTIVIALKGLPVTLEIVLIVFTLSFFIGFLVAVGRQNKKSVLSKVLSVYVSFIRGTPFMVQTYLFYIAIPTAVQKYLFDNGIDFNVNVIKGFWYQFLMNSIFFSQKNSSIKKKTLYLPNRRKRQMN